MFFFSINPIFKSMNYKSKKNKSKNLKYINYYQFKIIISSLIILFSFLIYLSIPVFYNYDTYDKVLKNKINQDFKINVINIKKIQYKFLPTPHFIIEDSVINLTDANDIVKLDKFKIFVDLKNLHKSEEHVKKIHIIYLVPLIYKNPVIIKCRGFKAK